MCCYRCFFFLWRPRALLRGASIGLLRELLLSIRGASIGLLRELLLLIFVRVLSASIGSSESSSVWLLLSASIGSSESSSVWLLLSASIGNSESSSWLV